MLTEPRRPILIVSPSRLTLVGSPTRQRVRRHAAFGHMAHQRAGAVDGLAFLVAGDDQADRAGQRIGARDGGDEGRDRALHVNRAAPV